MEGCSIHSDIGCNGEMTMKSPNSNDNGFVVCGKDDCESPLSSRNSEFEVVEIENTDDDGWEMDTRSYDELLKKFIENEEKLRVSYFKFQLSEQEIIKLKVRIENSESQLYNVREELKLKDEELHKQKKLLGEDIFMLKIQIENREIQLDTVHELLELSQEEVFKLKVQIEKSEFQLSNVKEEWNMKEEEMQKQIAEFDTHARECGDEIKNLMEQFEVANEKLELSKDEIEMLSEELNNKSFETRQLQNQLKVAQENVAKSEHWLVLKRSNIQMLSDILKKNETNHDLEVHQLKDRLVDLQACFSLEKEELHSKIRSLLENKIELTSKVEDWEIRNIQLENKLRQYETENLKQEKRGNYATMLFN
ncbi:hypothetical protein RYX36_014342 [Vicia faba]